VAGEIALGAALGLGFVLGARALAPRRQLAAWAIGLLAAALIYVGFAARAEGARGLAPALAGVAVFGPVALVGLRGLPLVLALAWVSHVAFDVAFERALAPGVAPTGYAALCAGFDLAVAGSIGWTALRRR
jgi:hypothetical protein